MIKDETLRMLREEDGFLSGEELARRLGVSRNAVWKAIRRLAEDGYEIEGVNRKGYRLLGQADVLSGQGIRSYLEHADNYRVEVYKTVTSTNLMIKERWQEPEGLIVAASGQTGGMGRLGRTFVSPENTGIYFSFLLKPSFAGEKMTLITTIAAVSVCCAIEKYTGRKPQIKWVNDVFLDDRKVCGILTQASFSMENYKPEYVAVGIGINVYAPENGFGQELSGIAGYVSETAERDLKNKLLAETVNRFFYYYSHFDEGEYLAEYKKRSFVLGKKIRVVTAEAERIARAVDIDEMCHLLVAYEDGKTEWLSTGEISVRVEN